MDELKKKVDRSTADLLSAAREMEERLKVVQEKEEAWRRLEEVVRDNAAKAKAKVCLNVGGKLFCTSKTTLLLVKGTFFYAMLSSGHWKPDDEGQYFIDRSPKYFDIILEYLRTGRMYVEGLDNEAKERLKEDLKFYQILAEPVVSTSPNPQYSITTNGSYPQALSQNTPESLQDDKSC